VSTVKVREPGSAPLDALTETLVAELVAFVGVQASGLSMLSAAERTAANTVLSVR
jgi:hypothetical protein